MVELKKTKIIYVQINGSCFYSKSFNNQKLFFFKSVKIILDKKKEKK